MGNRIKLDNKKLSEILTIALNDLEATEKDKRYGVNMEIFHRPIEEDTAHYYDLPKSTKCVVCFAGAVMAKRLKADIGNDAVDPEDFPGSEHALNFIDECRAGEIDLGDYTSKFVAKKVPKHLTGANLSFTVDVPGYAEDKRGFKKGIAKMVCILKSLGM